MWTCGIDIATQQATPAMHSSTSSVLEEMPSRSIDGTAAAIGPVPAVAAGIGAAVAAGIGAAVAAGAGPAGAAPEVDVAARARNSCASGTMVIRQNRPMPT